MNMKMLRIMVMLEMWWFDGLPWMISRFGRLEMGELRGSKIEIERTSAESNPKHNL